ncbi:hypothetical protein MD484_g3713, partial [Candolleomyces efflorescens]
MTDNTWIHSLYLNVTTSEKVENFLELSGEYEHGRWARVPQSPSSALALRQPLCGLVNAIIGCLVSGAAANRTAVNTRVNRFEGPIIEGTLHRCTPDVVVRASGPSFSPPKSSQSGFSNVASCIDTKLDEEETNYTHHLAYHAAYANADERTLGFDDTVQWSTADGSKAEGTVRTVGSDGTIISYQLDTDQAPLARNNLCGRGTTYWAVKDAEGNKLIVKDYWVCEDHDKEIKLLEEAKGLRGVCQIVSYEENRFQTQNFRGNVEILKNSAFRNRTSTRIVMKAYGPSIEKFTSVIQVLAALRDAIAAHRRLLSKGIIHRDISPSNILLGQLGAEEGLRGILIDLDFAFKCGVLGPDRANHKKGTRPFQSLMVLKTSALKPHRISAHDYLDDLESFFWVFSYLLIVYKADGTVAPKTILHEYLDSWNVAPRGASSAKFTFLFQAMMGDDVLEDMDEGWRYACADLFLKFRKYMRDIADRKDKLLCKREDVEKEGAFTDRFSSILKDVDEHYDHVLALFDEALEKATKAAQPNSPPSPAEPSPTPARPETPVKAASSTSDSPRPLKSPVSTRSTIVEPSSSSFPSSESLTTPCSPSRPPKRRCQEAELEDSCIELKRKCPPTRQPLLRSVVDPSIQILSSFYQYCLQWL